MPHIPDVSNLKSLNKNGCKAKDEGGKRKEERTETDAAYDVVTNNSETVYKETIRLHGYIRGYKLG